MLCRLERDIDGSGVPEHAGAYEFGADGFEPRDAVPECGSEAPACDPGEAGRGDVSGRVELPGLPELEDDARRAWSRVALARDHGEDDEPAEREWARANLAWREACAAKAEDVRRGLLILAALDPPAILEVLASVGVDVRGGLNDLQEQIRAMRQEKDRLAEWLRNAHFDIKDLRREYERLRREIDRVRYGLECVQR